MSGSWYDREPPYDSREGMMFVVSPERKMLICPDCSDVTTVDPKLLLSAVFNDLPPLACSRCGTAFLIFQQEQAPV